MVCLCFVWSVVEDDGLLDYVQVLHQFSFVALNQQTASRINLEINAFAMPLSVLNDLAEAMKALDGKKKIPQFRASFDAFSCGVLPESGGVGTLLKPHLQWGKG